MDFDIAIQQVLMRAQATAAKGHISYPMVSWYCGMLHGIAMIYGTERYSDIHSVENDIRALYAKQQQEGA